VAVLVKAGCNAGTCHGSPNGKNGFRLSLRGNDPVADYLSLTRDVLARRVDPGQPEASLLLLKPLGQAPHGGGVRLAPSGRSYHLLHQWVAAGVPDDPGQPALQKLEVFPAERELRGHADRQQLAVLGRFADGKTR